MQSRGRPGALPIKGLKIIIADSFVCGRAEALRRLRCAYSLVSRPVLWPSSLLTLSVILILDKISRFSPYGEDEAEIPCTRLFASLLPLALSALAKDELLSAHAVLLPLPRAPA